jgi:hypothetical protein
MNETLGRKIKTELAREIGQSLGTLKKVKAGQASSEEAPKARRTLGVALRGYHELRRRMPSIFDPRVKQLKLF